MNEKKKVFLDTSVLFAGIWSETGGARMILKLGEAGVILIILGRQVLAEIEDVLRRKAPNSLASMALILDRCNLAVVQEVEEEDLNRCLELVTHPGDARVLAEAMSSGCDYFVTLDREHFLNNERPKGNLPFIIGTPGDFLAYDRQLILESLE